MASILIALIIFFVLVFWNWFEFIKIKGGLPHGMDMLKIHVLPPNRRAFNFFVALFFLFLFYGVWFLASHPIRFIFYNIVKNMSDYFLVLFFGSVLINYLIRFSNLDKSKREGGFVWDAWRVSEYSCSGVKLIKVSNLISISFFLFFILSEFRGLLS